MNEIFLSKRLDGHLRAENDHDVDAVMKTFTDGSEVLWGGRGFVGLDAIRKLHIGMGFGTAERFPISR